MFGDKAFGGHEWKYPTPSSIPEETGCRSFRIPGDTAWYALVMGVLYTLAIEENWQQFEGGITPAAAAERWQQMMDEAWEGVSSCDLSPYWDDDTGDDATGGPDESIFSYESLADWAVTAFLAVSFTPAAAVTYVTTAQKLRLAFRTRDYGAIAEVFLDNVSLGTVDTYSSSPGLTWFSYDVPVFFRASALPPAELKIVHTGEANPLATPTENGYAVELIRKRIQDEEGMSFQLRQNPENSCELEQSQDGGVSWSTAFRYDLCLTPAQSLALNASLEIIAQQGSPYSPGNSYIYTDGDDPETVAARQDALCYACYVVVELCMEIVKEVQAGNINMLNIAQAVLTLIAAILPIAIANIPVIVVLAIALAAAIIFAYVAFITEYPTFDADNATMREVMRCILYHHLLGRPLTQENFMSAYAEWLGECPDMDYVAAATLMDRIINSPTGEQIYNDFVAALGAVYAAVEAGFAIDCSGCESGSWCYEWTADNFLQDWMFCVGDGTYTPRVGEGTNGGRLMPGGMAQTWSSASNQRLEFIMRNNMYIPATTTVTLLRIDGWKHNSTVNMMNSSWGNGVSPVQVVGAYPAGRQWFTYNLDLPRSGGIYRPRWFFNTNAGVGAGTFDVYRLQMHGTGEPPFGICNNCTP